MNAKTRKTIVLLLLLSIAGVPATTAFASFSLMTIPVEISKDSGPMDVDLGTVAQHDASHHSASHDIDEQVVKTSGHCDTNTANCNQCDTCSHCINLTDTSYIKALSSVDRYIISNYSDLYRSVDQALLLRPPIRS